MSLSRTTRAAEPVDAAVPLGHLDAAAIDVYGVPGAGGLITGTSISLTARHYFEPWLVEQAIHVDSLFLDVMAAAVAGTTMPICIYEAGEDWQPGAKVGGADIATRAVDATGEQTFAVSVDLDPGRYLLGRRPGAAFGLRKWEGSVPGVAGVNPAATNVGTINELKVLGGSTLTDPGTAWDEVGTGSSAFFYTVLAHWSLL